MRTAGLTLISRMWLDDWARRISSLLRRTASHRLAGIPAMKKKRPQLSKRSIRPKCLKISWRRPLGRKRGRNAAAKLAPSVSALAEERSLSWRSDYPLLEPPLPVLDAKRERK